MRDTNPPPVAAAYPEIAAYLKECHTRIIELTKERDSARRWAVALEAQNARALELLDKTSAAIDDDDSTDFAFLAVMVYAIEEGRSVLRGEL